MCVCRGGRSFVHFKNHVRTIVRPIVNNFELTIIEILTNEWGLEIRLKNILEKSQEHTIDLVNVLRICDTMYFLPPLENTSYS